VTKVMDAAQEVLPDVVALRRVIHSEPELGLQLPKTQAAVLGAIDGLGLDVRTGEKVTSVVADLRGAAGDGPTVLLRADMDALPMPEDTGLEFASTVDGAMHACGHDAHTAMLAGAARVLAAQRDELAGTVRFMFQPGEEGYAGAKWMLDEGLLDSPHVDAAFALHISPNLPSGSLWTKPGPLMASADAFVITVKGRGGHASTPHLANDPMPVAAAIIQGLQTFVTRRIDAFDPAVITVAKVRAGTTSNVIPETVRMEGTVRAVTAKGRKHALEGASKLAEGIAAAHDMEATVEIIPTYPPTVNDDRAAAFMLDTATAVLGADHAGTMPAPVMGAEDFSYVLEQRPGALAFLGVCPPGTKPALAAGCHSNRMVLHEDALAAGVAVYSALVTRFLAQGAW
jgi:hippurate hydrolase